jgi:hypothetical protein
MPLTQEQMIEQMQESRANHAEMIALRSLILNYIDHLQKAYPNNTELQESMYALNYTIRLRPVPDDRATYMNERYYARFGKRNATAKQRQAMIRAGVIMPRKRAGYRTKSGGQAYERQDAIMPREYPDDKPLEFETLDDLPKPKDENLTSQPSMTFDEPEDKY